MDEISYFLHKGNVSPTQFYLRMNGISRKFKFHYLKNGGHYLSTQFNLIELVE
uniref:Uncharacterized protein n=1 Tax=Rhizophora mucronata TaxID=61149 RepID=A0A2P2N4X2_RHIMU